MYRETETEVEAIKTLHEHDNTALTDMSDVKIQQVIEARRTRRATFIKMSKRTEEEFAVDEVRATMDKRIKDVETSTLAEVLEARKVIRIARED